MQRGRKQGSATMASSVDLQELVNGLAARLGRSVAIDDHQIKLIVSSRHFGDEDPVRVQSVMGRGIGAELVSRLAPFGLAQLQEPMRLPPIEDVGLSARWCFPIRWSGVLMGFLWLIDDGTLSDADRAAAAELAESAGIILYRLDAAFERRQADQNAIMRDLLSRERAVRVAAIAEIQEEGLLSDTRTIRVATLSIEPLVESEQIEAALLSASRELLSTSPARSLLCQVRPPGLTVLLTASGSRAAVAGEAEVEELERVARELEREVGARVIVGVGARQTSLLGARASYDQARTAARVATTLPAFGPVARWESLGVYAMLGRLDPQDLGISNYPPSLLQLAASRGARQLLETAETYLDLAGDAKRASAELHIHRATLYQRLARIEELSGLDMRSGSDRLTLHLGIKLARLSGQYDRLVEVDEAIGASD